jgi:hypothetical protein
MTAEAARLEARDTKPIEPDGRRLFRAATTGSDLRPFLQAGAVSESAPQDLTRTREFAELATYPELI